MVNLYDLDIKGGCQGCLRCGSEYKCAYTGKDGFIEFYNSVLVPADIIVFAGSITCRQLSWKWREFFDRSFFNTHTPSLVGKQFAFLVSGPLSLLPELRETYEAWTELQLSNLVAFISDESRDPERRSTRRWTSLPNGGPVCRGRGTSGRARSWAWRA